jgi:NAD(P)-dependent dehydrogenase (short-subunit alcohol dehydrogenase family)
MTQVRAAIPSLRSSKGRIVLVSSGAATGAYSTWGAYGSSKAAMNHLALTLNVEEPLITSISIRPGTVDTAMQKTIREEHNSKMDQKDVEKFAKLHSEKILLRPEQPGHVMAKLVLKAPHELSGKFLRSVMSLRSVMREGSTNFHLLEKANIYAVGTIPPLRTFKSRPSLFLR